MTVSRGCLEDGRNPFVLTYLLIALWSGLIDFASEAIRTGKI